ncbi:uncharacterized protein [Temnothorax nylanderi]|uniref:uncharacterized protein n=1 Tax=Temnothorax nylanderi TaxID=102681 RepID=UPI003A881532
MRIPRTFLLAVLCVYLHDIYAATLFQSSGWLTRDKRYLVFPPPGRDYTPTKVQLILGLGLPMEVDVSMIIGYVMKFNYVLPYNASYLTDPYVRYDRSINRHVEPDGNDASPPNAKAALMSRWEYYEILESAFESTRSGKACLLKAICEAAAVSFRRSHTLAAQLAHIFLTPSTTSEPFRNAFDQEYRAAEIAGQQDSNSCDDLFPECTESLLDYFTEIK